MKDYLLRLLANCVIKALYVGMFYLVCFIWGIEDLGQDFVTALAAAVMLFAPQVDDD